MDTKELLGKYRRLRQELETAYAAPVWDSGRIDRLADEISGTERQMAEHFGGRVRRARLHRQGGAPAAATAG